MGRLVVVLWQLGGLSLTLIVQGGSEDRAVQRRGQALAAHAHRPGALLHQAWANPSPPDRSGAARLVDQLTRLQDDLPAFDHAKALSIIQSELGAPAEQLFATFPDHPVAAASLGQVYKAKLLDGRWVAVKVQRPDLEPRLRLISP